MSDMSLKQVFLLSYYAPFFLEKQKNIRLQADSQSQYLSIIIKDASEYGSYVFFMRQIFNIKLRIVLLYEFSYMYVDSGLCGGWSVEAVALYDVNKDL